MAKYQSWYAQAKKAKPVSDLAVRPGYKQRERRKADDMTEICLACTEPKRRGSRVCAEKHKNRSQHTGERA